jgi:hypothetical protein
MENWRLHARLGPSFACRACICDKDGLGLQACVGCPPRRSGIALLGAYDSASRPGQIRRKDSNVRKEAASLRKTLTWIRFRPASPDA